MHVSASFHTHVLLPLLFFLPSTWAVVAAAVIQNSSSIVAAVVAAVVILLIPLPFFNPHQLTCWFCWFCWFCCCCCCFCCWRCCCCCCCCCCCFCCFRCCCSLRHQGIMRSIRQVPATELYAWNYLSTDLRSTHPPFHHHMFIRRFM